MKNLSLLLFVLCSLSLHSQSSLNTSIDAILQEVSTNGPGVAIGVYKDGKLLMSRSKGLANIGEKIPITSHTNFNIASISKQFTAACVMHLHQSGKLKLNDKLSQHIPELQGKLRDVTIQQLLNHTSGIRDFMSLLMIKQSPYMDFFNSYIGQDQQLYELIYAQRELEFEAGTENRYSNTNYWILGQVVKSISGVTLGAYAKTHVFDPLGMNNTSFQENGGRIVPNRAVGHVCECPSCEIFEYTHRSSTVGHSGLLTNIEDLLKWENEYYNHKVLSASSWTLMTTRGSLQNGEKIDYAAGLIIEDYKGHAVIQHSGQEPGFVTMLVKFPEHNLSIAVLANYSWADAAIMAYSIADLLLPQEPSNPDFAEAASHKMPTPPTIVELSPAALERFCGTYLYEETGEIRSIALRNDTLLYVRDNGPSSILLPLSATSLVYADQLGVRMEFTFREDGTDILWKHPIGDMHAHTFEPIQLRAEDISRIEGQYYSAELDMSCHLISSPEGLFLSLGEMRLPLTALSEHEFVGMSMFKLSIDHASKGDLILDAPRAGNLRFEKQVMVK